MIEGVLKPRQERPLTTCKRGETLSLLALSFADIPHKLVSELAVGVIAHDFLAAFDDLRKYLPFHAPTAHGSLLKQGLWFNFLRIT
jgi:hypothetical protein